jgi:hypothetical protein
MTITFNFDKGNSITSRIKGSQFNEREELQNDFIFIEDNDLVFIIRRDSLTSIVIEKEKSK